MKLTATLAPSRAKRSAAARPMPVAPPVTSTRFPESPRIACPLSQPAGRMARVCRRGQAGGEIGLSGGRVYMSVLSTTHGGFDGHSSLRCDLRGDRRGRRGAPPRRRQHDAREIAQPLADPDALARRFCSSSPSSSSWPRSTFFALNRDRGRWSSSTRSTPAPATTAPRRSATGERRPKSDLRFAAIGTIDETQCRTSASPASIARANSTRMLARIQNDLFDLGADLAVPGDGRQARAAADRRHAGRRASKPRSTGSMPSSRRSPRSCCRAARGSPPPSISAARSRAAPSG